MVEIWFESLIPFLLKDSHIVQCSWMLSKFLEVIYWFLEVMELKNWFLEVIELKVCTMYRAARAAKKIFCKRKVQSSFFLSATPHGEKTFEIIKYNKMLLKNIAHFS